MSNGTMMFSLGAVRLVTSKDHLRSFEGSPKHGEVLW